jgi:uncharacterized protein with FMN-binding domain
MKKVFLVLAVLGVVVVYSAGIRNKVPVLKKPSSLLSASAVASPTTNSGPTAGTGSATSGGSSTNTSAASGSATSGGSSGATTGSYKDGNYTGSVADAYYGNVQVAVTISGGKITAVKFLQYPDTHSTSVVINQQAMPYLQQEAIQAQSANVQLISGATFTSQAFIQSLSVALAQS